jgi:hypothetical protein
MIFFRDFIWIKYPLDNLYNTFASSQFIMLDKFENIINSIQYYNLINYKNYLFIKLASTNIYLNNKKNKM